MSDITIKTWGEFARTQPQSDALVIMVTSDATAPRKSTQGWGGVCEVSFADVDPRRIFSTLRRQIYVWAIKRAENLQLLPKLHSVLGCPSKSIRPMSFEDATQIEAAIEQAVLNNLNILVTSESGVGHALAIASFAAKITPARYERSEILPNFWVVDVLHTAHRHRHPRAERQAIEQPHYCEASRALS